MENTVTNATRAQSATKAFDAIRFWMDSGHSQLLSRRQALKIAAWGLQIAGYSELQTQVLVELIKLPDNLGRTTGDSGHNVDRLTLGSITN